MAKLPLLTGKELAKILKKMGFQHTDGRTTVVPVHSGEEIDIGLLNKIIKKDLQISREEFMRHIK